jgi:hypothetical protein
VVVVDHACSVSGHFNVLALLPSDSNVTRCAWDVSAMFLPAVCGSDATHHLHLLCRLASYALTFCMIRNFLLFVEK